MSTILEHSANTSAAIQYKGKIKPGKIPSWVRRAQLECYYNAMDSLYSDCLDELTLPDRFDKESVHNLLIGNLKAIIEKDPTFRTLIIRLMENYPRHPLDNKTASEYIISLKTLSFRVAEAGRKVNNEIAVDSVLSDIPYIVFSNLFLGNYAISYFHEFKACATEEHFRRNHLLIRERVNLKKRERALNEYFKMIEPIEKTLQSLLKSQFKLMLLILLSNSENLKEFLKKPRFLNLDNLDKAYFEELTMEHSKQVEELRWQLFQLSPELFNQHPLHGPTQAMWKDMVLARITEKQSE